MEPVVTYTSRHYIRAIQSANKFDAIEELARVFEQTDNCANIEELITALKEREMIMSTGIGFNLAIPHAKISSVRDISFAIGLSRTGIDFDSMDGKPVHLIILVIANEKQHKEYLQLLANIMAILKREETKNSIIQATDPDEILKIFQDQ